MTETLILPHLLYIIKYQLRKIFRLLVSIGLGLGRICKKNTQEFIKEVKENLAC